MIIIKKELIRRPDFINSIHVKNMLQIDNHYPDFHLFQPLMLFELFDFPMNITNFAYSKRHNLLFVGLGEKSLSSKISTILNVKHKLIKVHSSMGKEKTREIFRRDFY
jgi:hypothetical protein